MTTLTTLRDLSSTCPLPYLCLPLVLHVFRMSHAFRPPHLSPRLSPNAVQLFLLFFKSNAMIFQEGQTNKEWNKRNSSLTSSARLWLMSPKITSIILVIMHVDSCQVYCQHEPPNLSHPSHPRCIVPFVLTQWFQMYT